jgi:cell pole-organizing protein PopZ
MPQGEEDEVLDLTQMVNEDGSVTELDEDMVADPEPEPVAEEAEPELEDDFVLESEPDPEPDFDTASMPDMPDMDEELAAVEDTPPTAVDAGIVDKVTAQATAAALNQLVVDMPSYVGMGQGLSLEEIVKELLRPLLKEWLDQHLPGMAERLVQEEISRISRARQ